MAEQEANVEWTDEQIRVKRTVLTVNQADHIRNKTEGEMIAHMEGVNAMLEKALHLYGCYNGFAYIGPLRRAPNGDPLHPEWVGPDHRNFAEWRRLYHRVI